jgi:hypothetical protein
MQGFKFGGDDPDQVGNLTKQLADVRIDLQRATAENQRVTAENITLREHIDVLQTPSDLVLLQVKHIIHCVISFFILIIIFQAAGTRYLEENHPKRKKTTIVNGKTKTHTLKNLDAPKRNMFDSISKVQYYDLMSSIRDGDDKINMPGILKYTDIVAVKKFFDEVYKQMQDKLSNLVVNTAATNATDPVDFISDDE